MIDNKRLAKNAIYLYIRTFFVLIVSLYTSRLIFLALGETDLGIFNVVGGIVTLMAFFQSAQTKATSRFITYELGTKDKKGEPEKIFSLCFTIHVLIALVVLFLGETVGLSLVNHWIEIPPDRVVAANWIYQFALLTFCIHLLQVPYNAVIIAHERMSVFAYMSIFEVALKLGVVYLLTYSGGDKLILYGGLLSAVALVLLLSYGTYVKNKFPLYKTRLLWDKEKCLQIFSFSGWTLVGSSANTATQQGVSLLFNKFIGLLANTALGFANQVNAAVGQFVSSFTTAFNPQIIKLYAQKDYGSLHVLMTRASKFSFFLAYLIALPLIVNMDFILQIWLKDVPLYTTEFCQLILICSIIDATTGVINTSITATGNIKKYQIGISISFLCDLLLAFFLLKLGVHPALVFASRILTRGIVNMFIGLYFAKCQIDYNIINYIKRVLVPITITVLASYPLVYYTGEHYVDWHKLVITTIVSSSILIVCLFVVIMDGNERMKVINTIRKYGKR